jgi:hypothetical protein
MIKAGVRAFVTSSRHGFTKIGVATVRRFLFARSRILKKRKENEIMNKMPVARFIEIKATQEIGSCPCVSISAEVLIPQPCKIENIDNDKIKIAIEYAVATYVKIEEKKDFKK